MEVYYQPFLGRTLANPGWQKVTLPLNDQHVSGLIYLASQITQPNQLMIQNQGQVLDLSSAIAHTTNYIGPVQLPLHMQLPADQCLFVNRFNKENAILLRFDSLDFLQAALYLCQLLGLDWTLYIQVGFNLNYQRYIGKFRINSQIGLSQIYNQVSESNQVSDNNQIAIGQSLTNIIQECFHSTNIGFYGHGSVYVLATDDKYQNIAAIAAITSDSRELPPGHAGYYIYNVCTGQSYRGLGLMKSLLIAMLNEFPGATFYLFVEAGNEPAHRLYQTLGWKDVLTQRQRGSTYTLMRFN